MFSGVVVVANLNTIHLIKTFFLFEETHRRSAVPFGQNLVAQGIWGRQGICASLQGGYASTQLVDGAHAANSHRGRSESKREGATASRPLFRRRLFVVASREVRHRGPERKLFGRHWSMLWSMGRRDTSSHRLGQSTQFGGDRRVEFAQTATVHCRFACK